MAAQHPGLDGTQDTKENLSSDHGLSKLSLSSQTVHADDYLNQGQDVAPPLHVSTTFRYSRDPETLVPCSEVDVIPPP